MGGQAEVGIGADEEINSVLYTRYYLDNLIDEEIFK